MTRIAAADSLYPTLYRDHLARVSRSFALCIDELQEPMRGWTGLAYLLCRVLDTVEDAPWPILGGAQAQAAAFARLDSFVAAPPPPEHEVVAWVATLPTPLPPGETALLADCQALFAALAQLPAQVGARLRRAVHTMGRGMRHYMGARDGTAVLRLVDLPDVNRYCYYVAGLVGELLTDLFAMARGTFVVTQPLRADAQHFGLFLQKINLLKDQAGDEREGRFLCPARPALLASLREHFIGAQRYLTALPQDARDYRVFCAWSIFLGAASLPHIDAAHHAKTAQKIGRAEAHALLADVASWACDNAAIDAAVAEALATVPSLQPRAAEAKPGAADAAGPPLGEAQAAATIKDSHLGQTRRDFFLACDHGPLTTDALQHLGMI